MPQKDEKLWCRPPVCTHRPEARPTKSQNTKKRPDVNGDIGLGEESAKRIFAVLFLLRRRIFLLLFLIHSIHVY